MDLRIALIGVVRRRFAAQVDAMLFPDLSLGVPVWALTDPEHDISDGKVLVARLELDAENEVTTMELFG